MSAANHNHRESVRVEARGVRKSFGDHEVLRGVSFDVEPRDAELWIDGEYVGRVSDYSPYDAPLVLAAGRHVVDLRGRYYNPLTFEITVVPGQVIPYSGTLPYYR